jgi:hypothetical protein
MASSVFMSVVGRSYITAQGRVAAKVGGVFDDAERMNAEVREV